jgi:LmbE family N-acetylglucosaminyl deacetylase
MTMRLSRTSSEIFVPDGLAVQKALARTTHMAVAAHQDDIEMMGAAGVLECLQHDDRWLAGVVVTDGSGSPRDGIYGGLSDEAMRLVRRKEQRKAAVVGEYGVQVLLDHPSSAAKDAKETVVVHDLNVLVDAARPEIVYTHNLSDKHDTHVAVALRLIDAIRALPREARPRRLLGCEVWRDLDWLVDSDKVVLDVSAHPSLQAALLGVFDSQITGGKRYDLATLGRRRAHATFHDTHATDTSSGVIFAMDLTPLILGDACDSLSFADEYVARFASDVHARVDRLRSR